MAEYHERGVAPPCAARRARGRRCRASAAPVLQHHRGALLGDHHRRRVGVAGGDARHGRGVDDAQAARRRAPAGVRRAPRVGSSLAPIFAVPTGWKIVVPISPAAVAAARRRSVRCAPGRYSSGRKRASGAWATIRRVELDRIDRDAPVLLGREIVRAGSPAASVGVGRSQRGRCRGSSGAGCRRWR